MKNWTFTNGWSLKNTLAKLAYILTIMNLFYLPNSVQATEHEALPMAFFEFLGEGIVVDDEYLDPLNYADIEQSDGVSDKPAGKTTPTGDENEGVDINEK